MVGLVNRSVEGLEVPFRAFCCITRGGWRSLATCHLEREEREEARERRLYILTYIPFWRNLRKQDCRGVSEGLSVVSED